MTAVEGGARESPAVWPRREHAPRDDRANRYRRRRRYRRPRPGPAPRSVAIVLPSLEAADATGIDAWTEYQVLRRHGLRPTLHASRFEPAWAPYVRPLSEAARAQVLIYHHGIHWPEGEALLHRHRGRVRILRYHNVTPPGFFAPFSPAVAASLEEGRAQTERLVRLCTHCTADSSFSLRELLEAGASPQRASVLPPFHQTEALLRVPADPAPGQALAATGAAGVVLFVGRRVPNKGLHHFVRLAEACRRLHPPVRFVWIGGGHPALGAYEREIQEFVDKHQLHNVVLLHGKVPLPVLKAYYQLCDVFLSLSEHEGFCVPILEAQALGKPVAALARAAVAETAGPHAVLFADVDYDHMAHVIVQLLRDPGRLQQLGAAGHANYAHRFVGPMLEAQFLRLIRRAWATTVRRRRRRRGAIARPQRRRRAGADQFQTEER